MTLKTPLEASTTEPSKKETLFNQIKGGLHLAAQLILASPFKLPGKLVQGAKYVALAVSLLEGMDGLDQSKKEDEDEKSRT